MSEESNKSRKSSNAKGKVSETLSGSLSDRSSERSSESPSRRLKSQDRKKRLKSKEDEVGSLKTKSSSSKGGTLEKVLSLFKLTKPSLPESNSKKNVPEKLSETSKKSLDYMKERIFKKSQPLAKKQSEMQIKDTALLNELDDRLDKLKSLKVEHKMAQDDKAKKDFEPQSSVPFMVKRKEPDDGLDIAKRQSIDIIKQKVLGKMEQPVKDEQKGYQIAELQRLDTDEDVFSVIDSKDRQQKKKEEERTPKEQVIADKTKKAKVKRRRHRRRRHGHTKGSKLFNLLTKRKKVQKVLEENLLIKKIKENCELRSGHIKTDIRLGYKNNSIVIEPVVNSDLLYDKDYKTELEQLIDASRKSADKRSVGKASALNDASLIIKSIEKDSKVLQDLNKEIESELNSLNKIKLEKRTKSARKSSKRETRTDKGLRKSSDDKKSKNGGKGSIDKEPLKESLKEPKVVAKSAAVKKSKEVEKGSNETRSKENAKTPGDKKPRESPVDAKAKDVLDVKTKQAVGKADLIKPKAVKEEQKIENAVILNLKNCLIYQKDPVVCEGYRNETFSSRMDLEIEKELLKKEEKNRPDPETEQVVEQKFSVDDGEPGKDNVEVFVDEASLGKDNTLDDAKRMEVMNSEIKLREILRKEIKAKQDRDCRPKEPKTVEKRSKMESSSDERDTEGSSDDTKETNKTEPFKKK